MFRELGAPMSVTVNIISVAVTRNVLFAFSPSAWIFEYHRSIGNCSLFYAFLDPHVGFDVYARLALACLDESLEDFRIWVGKDYTGIQGRGVRIATGMLSGGMRSIISK